MAGDGRSWTAISVEGTIPRGTGETRVQAHEIAPRSLSRWPSPTERSNPAATTVEISGGQPERSADDRPAPPAQRPQAPPFVIRLAAIRRPGSLSGRLKREQDPPSPFVFTSERGSPFPTAGWRKMVARLGVAAKFSFKAHPHMLRHASGFQLANQGTDTRTLQAYLGHRNIHTRSDTRSCRPRALRTSGGTDTTDGFRIQRTLPPSAAWSFLPEKGQC